VGGNEVEAAGQLKQAEWRRADVGESGKTVDGGEAHRVGRPVHVRTDNRHEQNRHRNRGQAEGALDQAQKPADPEQSFMIASL